MALVIPAAIQTQPPPSRLADQVAPNAGDSLFVTWTMASEAHALAHHPAQVFAANIFYPRRDAIAWSDNLLAALPLFAPLDALAGGRLLVVYNIITLVGFAGVGGAVYLLAHDLIGRRGPALIAATLCSLSMARSISVGHTQLAGFLFVVLAVVALIRFLEHRGWSAAVAFGAAAAATWLVSAYYAVMLVLVLVPFLVVWLVQRRFRVGRFFWPGVGLAAAVAIPLVAPTLGPYIRLQRAGLFTRSASAVPGTAWSELWRVPPSLLYRAISGVGSLAHYDKAGLFPGLVLTGLVLALLAGLLVARFDKSAAPAPTRAARWLWPLVASCLPCLLLMVGPHARFGLSAGYVALRAAVPGVASLRQLDRFWMWPLCCLCLAAGAGAERILFNFRPPVRVAMAVTLLAVIWAELLFRPPLVTVDLSTRTTAANHALARLPAGPVFELPEPLGPTFAYVDAARQLRSLIDRNPRVDGYSGNLPPAVDQIERLATRLDPAALVPLMRRYGVRYLVLHGAPRPCSAGYSPSELAAITASLQGMDGVERLFPAGEDVIVVLAPATIDRTLPAAGPGGIRPAACT